MMSERKDVPVHRLNLKLTDEQREALKPIINNGGKVVFTGGHLDKKNFSLSFIACNSAFIKLEDV